MFDRSISPAPTAVTELQVVAVDSETLRVTWSLPLTPNGPLSHYLIYYREVIDQQSPSHTPTSDYNMTRVNFPGVSFSE